MTLRKITNLQDKAVEQAINDVKERVEIKDLRIRNPRSSAPTINQIDKGGYEVLDDGTNMELYIRSSDGKKLFKLTATEVT